MKKKDKKKNKQSKQQTQALKPNVKKLNPKWVKKFTKQWYDFLKTTNFPEPQRHGQRGTHFNYPESLIMLIAVLAVKCEIKSYLGIHRMASDYWKELTGKKNLKVISESQLRERLKKIKHQPGEPAGFISQLFPEGIPD